MKLLPHLLGWLLLVAMAVGLSAAGPAAERDPAQVSSILTYPLDREVRFKLEPDEAEVLLRTWLVSESTGWPADARVVERWCLDLAVRDAAGAEVSAWRVWVASRTSVGEDADGLLRPRVWTSDAADRVSIDRTTRIDVGAFAPRGDVLAVRAGCHAPGGRVLAMAARRGERSTLARLRLQEVDGAPVRDELAARVGAPRWADLPTSWRDRLLADVWDRLGALPPPDAGAQPTVRLSASVEDAAAPPATLLPPGGAAAWNLRGPVSFAAEWTDAAGAPAVPPRGAAEAVRADGTVTSLPLTDGWGPWRFDDAVVSVRLALAPGEAPLRVRARVARVDADPAFGDPPRRETAPGRHLAEPELVSLEMARVTDPIAFRLEPGEVARLRFRVPLAPDALTGLPGPVDPDAGPGPADPDAGPAPVAACPPGDTCVTLDALDADGVALTTETLALRPVASPFERYVLADTPATAAVGEAGARVFVPPAGAVRLRVTSTRPVDVSARVTAEDPAPVLDEPGYAIPDGVPLRVRFAPLDRGGWRARSPDDVEALAAAGRVVRVDAQVRLEPGAGADPQAAALAADAWRSHPLAGPYELVGEPDPDATGPGTHVRLGATAATVTVPADGRLDVAYRVDPARVGAEVAFTAGGVRMARTLATAADVLVLGSLPPGPARIVGPSGGLFLARGEGSPTWRVRKVWRTADGAEWTVPVPAGAAVRVYAYLATGASAWLGWTVEGADPRPGGHAELTDRAGTVPLVARPDAAASPLTFAGGTLVPAAPVTVRLADDLAGGARVRFVVHGASAWVRTTATFDAPAVATRTRHWARGEPR